MNKKNIRPFQRWSTNGFIGIFFSVITIFLIFPVLTERFYLVLFIQSAFILLILSSIYTLSQSRWRYIGGLSFLCLFLIFDFMAIRERSLDWLIVAYAIYSIYLLLAIIFLSRSVLTSSAINTNLIFGAITIYLLAGIFWSKLYFLASWFIPFSFKGVDQIDKIANNFYEANLILFDLLYYSFSTLTTLGEGDISPAHRLAKSLTLLEAMFGQLFMATVIAKMVSVWQRSKQP